MLKRKITSKILIILVFSLLYTSCSSASKTSGNAMADYGYRTAASASPQMDMSISLKYTESVTNAGVAPQMTPDFNTEEYNKITERGFVSPLAQPLSTFSIDVDTASYANVRRYLSNGTQVPPDAVRIEEMVNYFQYNYPEPDGDSPFSVYTEMAACPWNEENQLLLIGLKGESVDLNDIPPMNLVFLLDVSGSMEDPNKLPLVKQAFLMLLDNLRPSDRISIVTYAGSDKVVLEGATGENKTVIANAIENLTAGGSTAGARGIETAYEIAAEYYLEGGNNRVILATDGDFNVGVSSEGELTRLIEEKRDKGIYLSVLGFGMGNIKDNKMEALADNGNGNYAYIDSTLEARKVLVEEMGGTLLTIAKDVKLQVEFNPNKVKGYRLVGYENRMLNAEDFDDDTKDAGEMGAGHRVTALYEIIPAGSDAVVDESNLKYQRIESTGSDEWLTIQLRYKEPDASESKLLTYPVADGPSDAMSEDFIFASGVAEFGMLLRGSEYKGSASFTGIYNRLSGLECVASDPYKAEFLQLVKGLMK